ncbi:MAG TPA: GNAT family N-acetyltransferase [Candidatus Thermoplasmatota archaeon]|nr:GNAT family N-acetyltransferase [Candidatus Thermoplasmatota archaeon]
MVVQTGPHEAWPVDPLAVRLDRAYYALTRTTERHFGRDAGAGWFLTGVAGLDAPTMNRAVVDTADTHEVARLLDDATRFFTERDCVWSVVTSSFRDTSRWHSELLMRGLSLSTSLDVLAREPGAMAGPVPDVQVREAGPDETGLFTDILMEVFRMPRRFYPALLDMTEAWRKSGAKLYFGLDEDGQPMSTTLLSFMDGVEPAGSTSRGQGRGGVAGIYNVGTLRRARRQGHAKALMARALEDAKGADVVTLQVAPEGFVQQFYLDLGFAPVYHWKFYAPRSRLAFFGR